MAFDPTAFVGVAPQIQHSPQRRRLNQGAVAGEYEDIPVEIAQHALGASNGMSGPKLGFLRDEDQIIIVALEDLAY